MSAVTVFTLTTLLVVNLLLTLLILRRVNALSPVRPSAGPSAGPGAGTVSGFLSQEPALPAAGSEPAEFAAVTTGGETVSTGSLSGAILAGFFATDCAACKELIPRFMRYAETMPGGRQQVLAVIAGDLVVAAKLSVLLDTVARVVAEPASGPVATAFGVTYFPAVFLLDGRRVMVSAFDVSRLPAVAL